MKFHCMGSIAAAIACVGTVLPTSAMATTPVAASINSDIALGMDGLLIGEVIDQQGVAKAGMPVSIQFAGQEVVNTTTDANGIFAAKGLRGGEYRLITPQGGSNCRLWATDMAPQLARPAALVVLGKNAVRGQHKKGSLISWMKAHPYLTAGTVAAAIAVPLALADDDFDSGS